LTHDEVVAELWSGMTLGIGGWGSRRKPMSLVAAIIASDLRDLTIVSYGGPDVGMLAAAGKIKKLVFGFVSLDSIPLEPNFRKARQSGSIDVMELDEGMFLQGLRAAAWNLPFLPTPVGLGSDVLRTNPEIKTVSDPYGGPDLVAMPALVLDAAIVHMNRADRNGNAQYLGPDPYMDDWFCMAAKRAYVSAEKIGLDDTCAHRYLLNASMVHGVVEAPGGAGFTECLPDYPRDEAAQAAYVAGAR
jgi:glutaconate CoA-transferase subunit A